MSTVKVVVFDSNETLLDLAGLDSEFSRVFGVQGVRKQWFKQVLELALTCTVLDKYRSFEQLTDSALDMVADWTGTTLAKHDKAQLHEAILALPAHADVPPALSRLRDSGLRLAVLTNSTAKSAEAQLKHAGLDHFFERILSADAVERYKPAREAYDYAAEELDVAAKEIRFVAAHAWDVTGALAAGCRAAFVQRPEKALDPASEQPSICGRNMAEVADAIVRDDT